MPELTKEDFTFKTQPLKHQLEALCKSATKQNFAYLMEMGCVDGETEFLTTRGWVKFKDFKLEEWEQPLLVAQCQPGTYEPDSTRNTITFEQPISYIHKTVDKMIRFFGTVPGRRTPCLDIVVTPDHNMRCRLRQNYSTISNVEDDISAMDLYQHITSRASSTKTYDGARGEILQRGWKFDGIIDSIETVKAQNEVTKLDEYQLRVMVAIIADGNFPKKNSLRCVMEFSKPEKIKRFEQLCKLAGIVTVKEVIRGGNAVRFQLIAPVRKKIYDNDFWALSPEKMNIIFDEVFNWDGSKEENRYRFYTIHKMSADFIQFVCFINGYRTSIDISKSNNAPYYTVVINPNKYFDAEKDAAGANSFMTTVVEGRELEGNQDAYCFRMPAGQLVLRRKNSIFITGNSGKTKVIIDNMAYLKRRGVIEAAIVLAPKGVYRNWSTQEIPKHMPDDVNPQVLVWKSEATSGYKKKLMEDIRNYDKNTFPILVFNIESLLSQLGMETLTEFLKVHRGMLMGIVDESTCIKNHKAKRTKKALEIGAKCRVKRIATGSPITNSPLDLFSQFAFLNKQILGCGSFYAFRNVFANIERITTRQGQSFDKILGYKNLPLLSRRIADFSFRITKKQCLDLPEKIYITRDVELTPDQKRLYKQMKDLSFASFDDEIMSVQVALTKMLRLHQILCGSYTTDEGEIKQIPNNRLAALEEVLDETSGKVIIWANYLQNIYDIEEMIKKKFGEETYVKYIGATTSDDRVEAIKLFQNANSPVRFFIGNVQTAGRGITLTAASTVIYYSNNYSLEMRQQSEDRAHRFGQQNPVTYIDLVVRDSLDEKIIQALLAKRDIANEILHDDLDKWIQL